jgi:hypothetical protein
MNNRDLTQFASSMELVDEQVARWKNYRVVVITSSGGNHYAVAVVPSAGCEPSWFGTEDNRIYAGKPLGCH